MVTSTKSTTKKKFYKFGIKDEFVQDNISISKKNVLRGMHYTINNPQSQLLTVLEGKIFDCLVDLRKSSKSFGKFFSFILESKKKSNLYASWHSTWFLCFVK